MTTTPVPDLAAMPFWDRVGWLIEHPPEPVPDGVNPLWLAKQRAREIEEQERNRPDGHEDRC